MIPEEREGEAGPLPTTQELMEAQTSDMLCQNLKEVLKKDGKITVNEDELLCRDALTDGAVQFVVPERYRKTLLYRGHRPTFAGHPGTRRM